MEDVVEVAIPESLSTCAEYPALVQNVPEALRTIGGEGGVSRAASSGGRGRRAFLSLRWRPDDPMCHPIYGERHGNTGLLLRVARRRASAAGGPAGEAEGAEARVEIASVVKGCYRSAGVFRFV
ncbi:unnamed protein product [Ostreobium quekettii]|uniref:Transcription factor IIIC subunit Tfc1/Sfc1 triple barrel domain-containing protein n=1 Tax=Ostreobium quekettii TaxID=121088 RepID=A0A8S1J6Y6_9CHLO|nr:unnamed protein product [Ostreobium quekettii]